MNSNDVTHVFTPYWQYTLSDEERLEVQDWLINAGVSLMRCPGFDYSPEEKLITTRYYAINEMGSQVIVDLQVVKEDFVREFPADNAPAAVLREIKEMRDASGS